MDVARLLSSPTVAGSLILYARLRAGLSQRQLAARLGVSQPVIAAYEAGRRQPTVDNLIRIVRAAGFETRIGIGPPDDHDEVLTALEQQRPREDLARWVAAQEQFVDEARAVLERESE